METRKPVKSIVIREDGVYVSSMEEPKEPEYCQEVDFKNNGSCVDNTTQVTIVKISDSLSLANQICDCVIEKVKYEQALSAFTSSLIKVENPEFLYEAIEMLLDKEWGQSNPLYKEGTYPAPDGLQMEVGEVQFIDNTSGKYATVSFLLDKEQEKELIVELVENCSLVREGSQENGHDCWGNFEWTSYKYVYLNDKEQRCWDGCYIVHDGKEVKEFIIPALFWIIEKRIQYQEKVTGFNYGWTPSTEKDYNNPKSGVEYRMILVSPPQEKPEKELNIIKIETGQILEVERQKFMFGKIKDTGEIQCFTINVIETKNI